MLCGKEIKFCPQKRFFIGTAFAQGNRRKSLLLKELRRGGRAGIAVSPYAARVCVDCVCLMRGHGAYVSSRAGYRVTPALTAVGRCPNGPAVDSKPNVISRWTHRAFINRWNQAQRLTMLHSIAENLETVNPVTERAVSGPYHILWFTFHFLFFLKNSCVGRRGRESNPTVLAIINHG